MKAIGIEIDKKRAICFAVELDPNGNWTNITGKNKYIELNEDQESNDIVAFMEKIHTYFDDIQPDQIGIIARQTKGKFSAASVSFKLEALIQTYTKVPITFVSPQTLTAFFKKSTMQLTFENNYQEGALKLASYLLMK